MESDDLAHRIPRKRSRSPSESVISVPTSISTAASASAKRAPITINENENARPPAPKRLRRSRDVPAYDAPVAEHARQRMAGANPLSRAVLKKEAKKARRAANRAAQSERMRAGMEVDDDAVFTLGSSFLGSSSP